MILLVCAALTSVGLSALERARLPGQIIGDETENTAHNSASMSPCVRDDTLFPASAFSRWAQDYHGTVGAIVEEHMSIMTRVDAIDCTSDDAKRLIVPGQELRSLTERLPEWKDPLSQKQLHQGQMGLVLNSYLNAYECSNMHQKLLVSKRTAQDFGSADSESDGLAGSLLGAVLSIFDLFISTQANIATIDRELAIARPSLERTLNVLGGTERVSPLHTELTCLARTTAGLHTIASVTADVASCVPARAREARDVLRDLPSS